MHVHLYQWVGRGEIHNPSFVCNEETFLISQEIKLMSQLHCTSWYEWRLGLIHRNMAWIFLVLISSQGTCHADCRGTETPEELCIATFNRAGTDTG